MTHFSDDQISRYLHHFLTDAQREAMDRHLVACPACRARLGERQALQRRIRYQLQADLRAFQPSPGMTFAAITPRLKRRRWTMLARRSVQLVYGLATAAVLLALGLGLLLLFSNLSTRPEQGGPPPTAIPTVNSQSPAPTATPEDSLSSLSELAGVWQRPGPENGRYRWQVDPDGSVLVQQERLTGERVITTTIDIGQVWFEGLDYKVDSSLASCGGAVGRYRVRRVAEGLEFTTITDACDNRKEVIAGGLWQPETVPSGITSLDQLTGRWHRPYPDYPQPGNYWWQINADGTLLVQQERLVAGHPATSTLDTGTLWFEGTELQIQSQCGQIGRYQVQQDESDQLQFTAVDDPCDERKQVITEQPWQQEALRQ